MCVIVGSLMIYSRRGVMSSRFLYNSTPLNPSRRIVLLQNLTAKPLAIIIRTSFMFVQVLCWGIEFLIFKLLFFSSENNDEVIFKAKFDLARCRLV